VDPEEELVMLVRSAMPSLLLQAVSKVTMLVVVVVVMQLETEEEVVGNSSSSSSSCVDVHPSHMDASQEPAAAGTTVEDVVVSSADVDPDSMLAELQYCSDDRFCI
jgi:hypothetical protein